MDTQARDSAGMNRRGGTYNRTLRASDADREATAARLRDHYSEGRLDAEEFNERIDRCCRAKTVGELDDLFNDLPRIVARESGPERPRHDYRFRPRWRFAVIAPIIAAIIIVSILTGAHLFWLAWPLFFVFFFLGPFGRRCRYDYERRHGSETV